MAPTGLKLPLRVRLALRLQSLGPFFNFFALAIMTKENLVVWNQSFAEHGAKKRKLAFSVQTSLSEEEEVFLQALCPKPGRALALGCGEGREAIALAKKGWEVTGIDHSEDLIRTARLRAKESGAQVNFQCGELSKEMAPFSQKFHLICLLGQVYYLIPTQSARIQLLQFCSKNLLPEGRIVMNAPIIHSVPDWKRQCHPWRAALGKWVHGYAECELGDHWDSKRDYHHRYPDQKAWREEMAAAGFDFERRNHAEGVLVSLICDKIGAP